MHVLTAGLNAKGAVLLTALALSFGASPATADDYDPWPELRETLFEGREIQEKSDLIALEAPYRAYDAAVVPITIESRVAQSDDRYIKTLTLIVDKNPAPVAAVFNMTRDNGVATISTRVRVNEYTTVRAVAETSDGELHMVSKFVKAAGGCSAPALKDMAASKARIGKMKLKQSQSLRLGQPNEVQFLISHPNYTGFQMNQLTRHYIPAHFVQDMKFSYAGKTVMTVEGAISLSEDPSIHFSFVPQAPGKLSVEVRDTDNKVFSKSWNMSPGGES